MGVELTKSRSYRRNPSASAEESAAKYEALLLAIPDMMFVITRDGTYLEFKAEVEDDLLIPAEKIIGTNVRDTGFPKPLEKRILTAIQSSLDAGEVQTIEYELPGVDSPRHYEARMVPLNEMEVLTIGRNISEQKKAVTESDERRAFLRQIIDINPNFVFAKDREGRFTLINEAVAEAYGTSIDELIGKTDSDFNPNPHEVAHFRKDDLEVMNTLREKFIPEEVITDSKGVKRWLRTVKRPLVNADGQADHVLGVSVDITQYKKAVADLEKTSDELRAERETLAEKNAALRQILDHIEKERKDYREKLVQELEKSLLPEIRRLKKRAGDLNKADIERLESQIQVSLGKETDAFSGRYSSLSPREQQICDRIGKGMSSKEISEELNLSLVTIHKHRERIRKKLGLTNMGVNLSSYLRTKAESS
jgi:PAS domain S-box-containing protein